MKAAVLHSACDTVSVCWAMIDLEAHGDTSHAKKRKTTGLTTHSRDDLGYENAFHVDSGRSVNASDVETYHESQMFPGGSGLW